MQTAGASLEAFESVLEAAVDRLPHGSAVHALAREHFALDDPAAQRGKRLRPRILIAAAEAEGASGEDAFPAAAAVELLHNFSLVHDDIEDRDELRHGRPTLWVRHGIAAALSAGDALCALSFAVLQDACPRGSSDRVLAMLAVLHRALRALCAGQGADIGFERAAAVTFDEYLAMIGGKTAALFGAACELGALCAGCDAERAEAYARMGRAYGIAFQIRDDVLGAWGAPQETGKPAGADLRRRKWSFPVAWAMSGPPSADRDRVASAYAGLNALDAAEAEEVSQALLRLGARRAADAACDEAIADATSVAARHRLDPDGRLAVLFQGTARRIA